MNPRRLYQMFLITALLLLSAPAYCSRPDHYEEAMNQVDMLLKSPNVRPLPYGHTISGRAIPAFVISDFSKDPTGKARILICAGQHGDEYNPIKSVMAVCKDIATGAYPNLLARCVFIVIPAANPDGVAQCKRLNALKIDINRDWDSLRSSEARFVNDTIRTWKPHLLIDAHEWTEPSMIDGNTLEVAKCSTDTQAGIMSGLASISANIPGLIIIHCTSQSNKSLFHRHYALQGYGAYLIETAFGEEYSQKNRTYSSIILGMATTVSAQQRARETLSPQSRYFNLASVSAYLNPTPLQKAAASPVFYTTLLLAVGYCLLVWVIKSSAPKDQATSCRWFRGCNIDEQISTSRIAFRQLPQPLTSRSFIRRRMRRKYASLINNPKVKMNRAEI